MSDRPQTHRRVVSYIDKSRDFYAAHGYETPYAWACFDDVPFRLWELLDRSLSDATIGVVTTAFPVGFDAPKSVYAQASSPIPEAMFTQDLSWDKQATHTDDVGTFLPLAALERLADQGVIGRASDHFYGVPTEYSQRRTHDDAARIIDWARDDGVDAMILVPL